MSPRPIVDPTPGEYGGEEHPAFGQIGASRVSNSPPGQVLFDSDITHQHTIRITITTATRERSLHQERIHDGRRLIEVELSEAQWASFVSSMTTSGVPCTIRATESDWNVPGLPYAPRLTESMAEVKDAVGRLADDIRQALTDYEQALTEKAPAKVRNDALRKLHYTVVNAEPNVTFAAKSLTEHAENVVQRARSDIEAMVSAEATRLGLDAGQARGLPELPAMPSEEVSGAE